MNEREYLPLPVAVLVRRARNSVDGHARLQWAWWACEASIRLAVAAVQAADRGGLRRASVGTWTSYLRPENRKSRSPGILRVVEQAGRLRGREPENRVSVSFQEYLSALPEFRNNAIAHRPAGTSDDAAHLGDVLIDGLDAAWEEGVFWRAGRQLICVKRIEETGEKGVHAKVLTLMGGEGSLAALALPIANAGAVVTGRLYILDACSAIPLYPWIIYDEENDHVLFFLDAARKPAFGSLLGRETLSGDSLEKKFARLGADVESALSQCTKPDPVSAQLRTSLVAFDPILEKAALGWGPRVLSCNRERHWAMIAQRLTANGNMVVVTPGSVDDGVSYFVTRVKHHLPCRPPRQIHEVKWPALFRPSTEGDYLWALADALGCDAGAVPRRLKQVLEYQNLVLIHPSISDRFVEPGIIDYYCKWLPSWVSTCRARMALKCVQPIEWIHIPIVSELFRGLSFIGLAPPALPIPSTRASHEAEARTLLRLLNRARRTDLPIHVLPKLHELRNDDIRKFLADCGYAGDQLDDALARVAVRGRSTVEILRVLHECVPEGA